MRSDPHPPIVFIGGGTMAAAILRGATASGAVDPKRVAIVEPRAEGRASFEDWAGMATPLLGGAMAWLQETEACPGDGQVLLAVKPQSMSEVAAELGPLLSDGERVVISILAGATSERVHRALGGRARVIRVMPNTPAQIGRGMTAIASGAGAAPGDERLAERVFGAVGAVIAIPESLMDAFTALAGSGPAYVFFLAEAMARAGVEMGFGRDDALRIVRQTIAGAGMLLEGTGADPVALREAVTSKGGTTAAAVEVLAGQGAAETLVRAILAARDRGAALGSG